MMRAPSKTKLLTMRSYIDFALENPEDEHNSISYMYRIWSEIKELCDEEEIELMVQDLLGEEDEEPISNDPETLDMIAACKKWREEKKLIEDTEEVTRHGETWKETQDRIFREMQEESAPIKGVARSADFVFAQNSLAPKDEQK